MSLGRMMRAALCSWVVIGLSACGSQYESIDVRRVGGHVEARGSHSGFTVPEGGLLVFDVGANAEGSSRDYDVTDVVELSSQDVEVARFVQGLATDSWMLMGVHAGQTSVDVRINGEVVEQIPVDILEQEVVR